MTAGITEIFTDGGTGKRCEVLQGSRIGSGGSYNDSVVHGAFFTERIDDVGYGRSFLSHGHVNTVYRIAGFIIGPLADDRVDGYGGLTRLTVTDDQLTLSASYGNHGIDGFQTRL